MKPSVLLLLLAAVTTAAAQETLTPNTVSFTNLQGQTYKNVRLVRADWDGIVWKDDNGGGGRTFFTNLDAAFLERWGIPTNRIDLARSRAEKQAAFEAEGKLLRLQQEWAAPENGTLSMGGRFRPSRVSPPVLRLAAAYVISRRGQKLQDFEGTQSEDFVRDFFLFNFFHGFTAPGATMTGGTEADRQGFIAGQKYRLQNPQKLKETMEGFGYEATEAEGTYICYFEHSEFYPRGKTTQMWWLSTLGDSWPDLGTARNGIHLRVTGFLSPAGAYGHLNGYDHEFFATKIIPIDQH